MPQIIPIKDQKNTSEISDMCHKTEEPIYVTKKWLWRYGNYEHGDLWSQPLDRSPCTEI